MAWREIIYQYDGSFEGLLCCVFESYTKKERPTDGEALISELPEDIQKLIRICESNPDLAAALLSVAQQIEKGQVAGE